MYNALVVIHLLAATVWTGGHVILSLTILPKALKQRDCTFLAEFESVYEKIGIPALLLQVITGLWLVATYLPNVGAWFDLQSSISRVVTIKLILLVITIALALHTRLKLVPNLSEQTLNRVAIHIVLVTTVAVAFAVVGVGFRLGFFD
jgi:putative copper export protein